MLCCHNKGWSSLGIEWEEIRDAMRHPVIHGTDFRTKNYPDQNIHAKVGEPCFVFKIQNPLWRQCKSSGPKLEETLEMKWEWRWFTITAQEELNCLTLTHSLYVSNPCIKHHSTDDSLTIPWARGRLRQEDCVFQASLGWIVRTFITIKSKQGRKHAKQIPWHKSRMNHSYIIYYVFHEYYSLRLVLIFHV